MVLVHLKLKNTLKPGKTLTARKGNRKAQKRGRKMETLRLFQSCSQRKADSWLSTERPS